MYLSSILKLFFHRGLQKILRSSKPFSNIGCENSQYITVGLSSQNKLILSCYQRLSRFQVEAVPQDVKDCHVKCHIGKEGWYRFQ